MSEKTEGYFLPAVNLIEVIDQAIQRMIDRDVTGSIQKIFDFFDSQSKPLDHREFIQFWGSLSAVEQDKYMLQFI